MKKEVIITLYYTKNFNEDFDTVTELCKKYGYKLYQVLYDPETMKYQVWFKHIGGVTNGNKNG